MQGCVPLLQAHLGPGGQAVVTLLGLYGVVAVLTAALSFNHVLMERKLHRSNTHSDARDIIE
jgi:hypothetical protein